MSYTCNIIDKKDKTIQQMHITYFLLLLSTIIIIVSIEQIHNFVINDLKSSQYQNNSEVHVHYIIIIIPVNIYM